MYIMCLTLTIAWSPNCDRAADSYARWPLLRLSQKLDALRPTVTLTAPTVLLASLRQESVGDIVLHFDVRRGALGGQTPNPMATMRPWKAFGGGAVSEPIRMWSIVVGAVLLWHLVWLGLPSFN